MTLPVSAEGFVAAFSPLNAVISDATIRLDSGDSTPRTRTRCLSASAGLGALVSLKKAVAVPACTRVAGDAV